MQGNKKRDTRPELVIRRAVHAMGFRYRVAARPVTTARWTADMVFPGPRVAVFIDGCFWHGCPNHFKAPRTNTDYWRPKIERNKARDEQVNSVLAAEGWTVVRIWEHEAPSAAVAEIVDAVQRKSATRCA